MNLDLSFPFNLVLTRIVREENKIKKIGTDIVNCKYIYKVLVSEKLSF